MSAKLTSLLVLLVAWLVGWWLYLSIRPKFLKMELAKTPNVEVDRRIAAGAWQVRPDGFEVREVSLSDRFIVVSGEQLRASALETGILPSGRGYAVRLRPRLYLAMLVSLCVVFTLHILGFGVWRLLSVTAAAANPRAREVIGWLLVSLGALSCILTAVIAATRLGR